MKVSTNTPFRYVCRSAHVIWSRAHSYHYPDYA